MVSAIIVAAGKSRRMNMNINKQYLMIYEMPVLAITLLKFQNCRVIDEIVLVVNEQEVEYSRVNVVDKYDIGKLRMIVKGGNTRQQSVYNGLINVSTESKIVAVHDGARPFIDITSIQEVVGALKTEEAAAVGVPVKDTIKVSDENGYIINTPERSLLWAIQTPQVFKTNIIKRAYEYAIENNISATDDASLVENMGTKVKIIQGSYDNIKITTPEDIELAKSIYNKHDFKGQ